MNNRYELLNLAQRASALAARNIRSSEFYNELTVETKSSPTDMVTEVDRSTEALIREYILSARPDDGFIGEETDEVAGKEVTWIVDPIDGTTNFVYNFPVYAVSIAATDGDGNTLCGVVLDVYSDDHFWAVLGGGAYLNNLQISVSETTELDKALISTGFSYSVETRVRQAELLSAMLPRVRDIRRAGAASLDLAYLAAGRVDGYYETGLWPWDYQAGVLIVREAGGKVGSLASEEPSKEMTIAANSNLYSSLKDIVSQIPSV